MRLPRIAVVVLAALAALALRRAHGEDRRGFVRRWLAAYPPSAKVVPSSQKGRAFLLRLAGAAAGQVDGRVAYDPAYVRIAYPGGDVPAGTGVCTDVLIRAYRAVGIDLQVLVHDDMEANFALYPRLWGRRSTDTNIDHRRVPNLLIFFRRHGQVLPLSARAEDYGVGDIVAYDLGGGVTHIGLVSERRGAGGRRLLIHNIGQGPKAEDALLAWPRIGHFRFTGKD